MVNNEDILKDILLKMNYNPSKTLSEQDGPKFDRVGAPKSSSSASSSSTDYWKVGCKYPDKALQPPSIDGVDGPDAMIQGYCFYPVSSNKNSGQVVGVWVPAASEVNWFDVADISEYVDQKISTKDMNRFWSGFTDDQIQTIVTKNLVIGTIHHFNVGSRKVAGWFTKTGGSFDPNDVRYKGLFYTDDGKAYIGPKWEDRRSGWDKLVDEYGTAAQIFTALAFVAVSIATGGVGGVALLATEIAIEGTLGAIIAQRELEKGNKVGAGVELLFGLTPWLKAVPGIRALKPGVVKSLTSKMGKAGLKTESTVDDIVTFYRGLTEAEQQAFTRLVKDTSDELSEAAVKEALGKALAEEVYDYARKNPDVFKDLSWYQKVWAKEVGVNGILMVSNIAYQAYFGENLTQEEKNNIKGIFLKMPEDLAKEVTMQILSSPEKTEKFIEASPKILQTLEESAPKISNRIDSLANVGVVYDAFNENDIPLNNPKVDDASTIPDGFNEISFDEYLNVMDQIEDGSIDINSLKEMRDSNGDMVYLYKKSD
jgi:hypothetical protein